MTLAGDIVSQALWQGVSSASTTERPVILYWPDAPRPRLPYTAIQYQSGGHEMFDWQALDQTSGALKNFGFRELIFAIHFYGPNSFSEAQKVMAGLTKQTVRELMKGYQQCGLAILQVGNVQQFTALIDDAYEQRAAFEITVSVNLEDGSTEDDAGYFDKVDPIVWTNEPA